MSCGSTCETKSNCIPPTAANDDPPASQDKFASAPKEQNPEVISNSAVQNNLETLRANVEKAAKSVECVESAIKEAEAAISRIDRELLALQIDRQQAEQNKCSRYAERIAVYWDLWQAIVPLEKALAPNKGKHRADTPQKQAIAIAGGNTRYQAAKDVGGHFSSRMEAAKCERSLNEVVTEIKEKRKQIREKEGKEAPGPKPKTQAAAKRGKEKVTTTNDNTTNNPKPIAPSQNTTETPGKISKEKMLESYDRAIAQLNWDQQKQIEDLIDLLYPNPKISNLLDDVYAKGLADRLVCRMEHFYVDRKEHEQAEEDLNDDK